VTAEHPAPHAGNWKVVLEYDGAGFCGWERQKNGYAVQQALEDALRELTQETVVVHGSGRTDAGVHAAGQVASFRLTRPMIPRKLRLALNALLPQEVAALSCDPAPDDFHARFSATGKTYRYAVLNGPVRRPSLRGSTFHFPQPLDVPRMAEAARALVGTHDFRAFAKEAYRRKNCVRTIYAADVAAEELDATSRLIRVDLSGSGFLYNMVRIVVGTLIDVGLGRRPTTCFAELVQDGARRAEAGFTVPPTGLTLLRVAYGPRPAEASPPAVSADDDGDDD
jgi:tRNA pseudouridine38-40 synthase